MVTLTLAEDKYTGSPLSPTVTVKDGDKPLTRGTDYTLGGDISKTNCGSYTLTVTGTGNYSGTVSKGWSIAKAGVTAPAISEKQYTGAKQTADVDENTLYTVTKNDGGTDVGSYDVVLTLSDAANYKWTDSEAAAKTLTFSIVQAETNDVTVSIEGWTYGGAANTPTSTATFGEDTATYTYAASQNGEYAAKVPTDAGTWYVKASVAGTVNYKGGEATAAFTIARAGINPAVTLDNWTYGGTASVESITGNTGEGTVTYQYKVKDAADDTYSDKKPTNAGDYTVRATIDQTTNYNGGTATADFTINRAASSVATAPTALNLKVTGSAQDLVKEGEANGGTMKYRLGNGEYSEIIPQGTEAGEYTVYYKVFGDSNHTDTDETSLVVRITEVKSIKSSPDTLVYNGKDQPLVTGGSVTGGTLLYALGEAVDKEPTSGWDTAVPTGNNAGTYYVWYKVDGGDNYNSVAPACIRVPIAKAPIEPVVSITGWTYGRVANDPSVKNNPGGDASYEYSETAEGNYSSEVPSKAGSYYVRATVEETANYLGATTKPLSFAISKANITIRAKDKNSVYGAGIAALEYEIDGEVVGNDDLGVEISAAVQKGSDVGEYPITLTWNGNSNYSATLYEGIYTVTKATVTVTADAKSKAEGEADPALTYTVTGLVGSDKLTGALTRDAGEAPGSYAIRQGTLTAGGNYAMTFNGANLTIIAKPSAPAATATPAIPATPAEPSHLLLAKLSASGKRALKLTWTKVPGAEGFDIYLAHCGQPLAQVATVGGATYGYALKGLEKYEAYKVCVRAWRTVNGVKTTIGESPAAHAITGGYTNKYTNPKKVSVKKSKVKLAVGKTAKVRASVTKVKNSRNLMNHESKLRYYSSNPAVATVSANGRITAVGAGSCKIYAVAVNGLYKAVTVTVK